MVQLMPIQMIIGEIGIVLDFFFCPNTEVNYTESRLNRNFASSIQIKNEQTNLEIDRIKLFHLKWRTI